MISNHQPRTLRDIRAEHPTRVYGWPEIEDTVKAMHTHCPECGARGMLAHCLDGRSDEQRIDIVSCSECGAAWQTN